MSLIKKFFLLSLKGKLILKIEIILLITDELFTNLIVKSKCLFILNNIEGKKIRFFEKIIRDNDEIIRLTKKWYKIFFSLLYEFLGFKIS